MKHRVETLETKIVNFRSFELQTHCSVTKLQLIQLDKYLVIFIKY